MHHTAHTATHPASPGTHGRTDVRLLAEDGSLVTEYGLIAIVGATVASLVIKWASNGAIWQLFDAVTKKVRVLLGA
ncbi:MAG: hypothetical protein KY462_08160 [Actinobacteria bacterium]|nr:hypothetical protein [Actinomycetota bacterium]